MRLRQRFCIRRMNAASAAKERHGLHLQLLLLLPPLIETQKKIILHQCLCIQTTSRSVHSLWTIRIRRCTQNAGEANHRHSHSLFICRDTATSHTQHFLALLQAALLLLLLLSIFSLQNHRNRLLRCIFLSLLLSLVNICTIHTRNLN